MLELRPNCESCNKDLLPDAHAFICTFECTFCESCTKNLYSICPNCGGNLCQRPIRPPEFLLKYPASTKRIIKE